MPSSSLSAVARRAGRATDPAMYTFEPHYGQWLAWQAFHELHYRIVVMVAGTGSGGTLRGLIAAAPGHKRNTSVCPLRAHVMV